MCKLVALIWVLGLSLRSTCTVLGAFGVSFLHMSVWRDLQEQAGLQRQRRQWLPTRVLGVDRAYVRCLDKNQSVLVAVDLGQREPEAIGYVDEDDPRAVQRFLRPLDERLGVSVFVTDDLLSFRTVTDQLCGLLIRLSENWHRYRVFDCQPKVPWTNNDTEQIIGKLKMRSRTVRGYKSIRCKLTALLLSGLGCAW